MCQNLRLTRTDLVSPKQENIYKIKMGRKSMLCQHFSLIDRAVYVYVDSFVHNSDSIMGMTIGFT